jgi:hypothetical protein
MADKDTDKDDYTSFNLTSVPTHQYVGVITALAAVKHHDKPCKRIILVGPKNEPDWRKWKVATGSPFQTQDHALACQAAVTKLHPTCHSMIIYEGRMFACVKYVDPDTCEQRVRWATISDAFVVWVKTIQSGLIEGYFATTMTPLVYCKWQ